MWEDGLKVLFFEWWRSLWLHFQLYRQHPLPQTLRHIVCWMWAPYLKIPAREVWRREKVNQSLWEKDNTQIELEKCLVSLKWIKKIEISLYLEHEVTNFKNNRLSSSVKSFARISHSFKMEEKRSIKKTDREKKKITQLMTLWESWNPPKYCVLRLKSFKSRGLVSPE